MYYLRNDRHTTWIRRRWWGRCRMGQATYAGDDTDEEIDGLPGRRQRRELTAPNSGAESIDASARDPAEENLVPPPLPSYLRRFLLYNFLKEFLLYISDRFKPFKPSNPPVSTPHSLLRLDHCLVRWCLVLSKKKA